jgi:hypothetical protein
MADVRAFEREWPAATSRSQTDRDDDGDDDREPVRTVGLDVRHLGGCQLTVADETSADEDGDTAEDRGQIRLVKGVDPMDVGQTLATPDASPLE